MTCMKKKEKLQCMIRLSIIIVCTLTVFFASDAGVVERISNTLWYDDFENFFVCSEKTDKKFFKNSPSGTNFMNVNTNSN